MNKSIKYGINETNQLNLTILKIKVLSSQSVYFKKSIQAKYN